MQSPLSRRSKEVKFQLARLADAKTIASMSRELIEAGLDWRWTPLRVAAQIRCRETVVLCARLPGRLAGFAIMHFQLETAHLNLLAVRPDCQRLGIGRRLVEWLEQSALVAGIITIQLELRANNSGAHAFYQALGYRDGERIPGYYDGRETAVRMLRDIRIVKS